MVANLNDKKCPAPWSKAHAHQQSWATEAMKRKMLHRFNFFASIKRFTASPLALIFAVINVSSLHRFPNLPPLP
jgi:hypothetical protein